MAEALWVQTLGVDYSAAEDRRLIWTMATPGISRGLQIQTVSGLQVKVTSGAAVIDAGDSTGYVGYMTGDTTLTLPANQTSAVNIYITVDPTTAATTIVQGSSPANPSLNLGNVTTGASSVGVITQTTARAVPPGLSGTVLPITGGTLTGALTAPSLAVSGQFVANSSGVSAPHGVFLGGATTPTARHYARVSRTTSFTGVVTNTWTSITFGTNDVTPVSDYGVTAHSTSTNSQRLICGAAGDYALGGSATFAQPGNNIGTRRSRVVHYNSAGTAVHIAVCSTVDVTTNVSTYLAVNWNCNMYAAKNDWFEFQVWHNQGNNEPLDVGTGAAQDKIWASMRLIQAD